MPCSTEEILVLIREGNFQEAEKVCDTLVDEQAENSYGWYLLGYSTLCLRRVEKAKKSFRQAVILDPQNSQYHFYYGNTLQLNNELDDAIAEFRKAIELSPQLFEAHFNLACCLMTKEEGYSEAASILKELANRNPEMAEIYFQWGVAAKMSGDEESALFAYKKAIEMKPDWAEAYFNLALLITQKEPGAAIPLYEKALCLKPGWAQVYNSLGTAYQRTGVLDKAVECYLKALEEKPDWHLPYHNLGEVFILKNQIMQAIRYFRESIKRNPEFAGSHFNLGILLLQQGMYREGWQEYEWRLADRESGDSNINQTPMWDGSDPRGRTILIRSEQGLGDAIQFVRYVRLIHEAGGRVWLEASPRLAPLFETCPGVDRVITHLPPAEEFDFQAPLMSLPRIFGTTLDTIPADIPYLFAQPCDESMIRLLERYGSSIMKIGISWRSGDSYRSHGSRDCKPGDFRSLARIPRLALFSLQFSPFSQESWELKELGIEDLAGKLGDFASTAAIVREMDLVITVDTALAHLAGALGKPVWTLLNFAADWRWLIDREDTPWYPNMRLFRQRLSGDWAEVFARVERDLSVTHLGGRK